MENGTGENIKKKNNTGFIRTELIVPICVFILMIGMLLFGVSSVTKETAQKEQESLQNAVIQSAVHCYSVEGAYPESLAYLKKHYGITWNEKKYKISYEVVAKNIRPEVQVILLDE